MERPFFPVDFFLDANFQFVGNDKDIYRRRESTMTYIDIEVVIIYDQLRERVFERITEFVASLTRPQSPARK